MKEAEEVENSCNLRDTLSVQLTSVLKQLMDKAVEICPLVDLMMRQEQSPTVDDDAASMKTNTTKKRARSEPESGKKALKRRLLAGGRPMRARSGRRRAPQAL